MQVSRARAYTHFPEREGEGIGELKDLGCNFIGHRPRDRAAGALAALMRKHGDEFRDTLLQ